MALWSEILQRLVGSYQKEKTQEKFPRSPPEGYSGEKIPLFPPRDTLVRKFASCMSFLKAKPGHPPLMGEINLNQQ